MSYSGYITDINELYIFAEAVDNFCYEFRNGCRAIASCYSQDYNLGFRELLRIREWVEDLKREVEALEQEYDQYTSQEEYDQAHANRIRDNIREAKDRLKQAAHELRLAETLFNEFTHELDIISDISSNYANAVDSMGNDAVRAIRGAAEFIERTYNS